ncbi:MAG: retropepsin-like aspartic protease [Limisphaerales bacterium]
MPKTLLSEGAVGALLALLLLPSCVTTPSSSSMKPAAGLPADVMMNTDAGRGNHLFVTLRLEDGEELPFLLDTGASGTCLDKSLEPRLGKRLGTDTWWHFGDNGEAGSYAAPRFYLGNSLLRMTGTNIVTLDLGKVLAGIRRPVLGVLGMDILENYCVQLDFVAGRIRFLDDEHADKKAWGKAFFLSPGEGCPVISFNLAGGASPGSLIDTGWNAEGYLTPSLFGQCTNRTPPAPDGHLHLSSSLPDGEVYPDVDLDRMDERAASSGDSHMKFNLIGIRFLARHLVTLDFPKRTIYLKRTSAGPLFIKQKDLRPIVKSAYRFIEGVRRKGQLPGWPKTDKLTGRVSFRCYTLDSGTLDFLNKGDPSIYHYQVTRASPDNPWELQKA